MDGRKVWLQELFAAGEEQKLVPNPHSPLVYVEINFSSVIGTELIIV